MKTWTDKSVYIWTNWFTRIIQIFQWYILYVREEQRKIMSAQWNCSSKKAFTIQHNISTSQVFISHNTNTCETLTSFYCLYKCACALQLLFEKSRTIVTLLKKKLFTWLPSLCLFWYSKNWPVQIHLYSQHIWSSLSRMITVITHIQRLPKGVCDTKRDTFWMIVWVSWKALWKFSPREGIFILNKS